MKTTSKEKPMSQKHILETIVDRLVTELNTYFTQVGKKQVKSKLPNLKLSVKTLIGNVLISENKVSGQGYASIHLSPNWYSDSTRYKTKHSYRIFVERAYRGLIHLGYLSQAKAGVSHGSRGLYLTRYRATSKLLRLFDSKSLIELPVLFAGQLEVGETIRVQQTYQEQVPLKEFDKYGEPKTRTVKYRELVEYDDTEQTKQMRHNLQLINDRIATKWIDLELSKEEHIDLVTQMAKKDKEHIEDSPDDYRPLMLSKRSLYRVFNDNEFKTGGRFYGGWWQEIPSEYRDRITIDGKRTIQLDYSGLHPHILYHEKDLELTGDPYQVNLTPSKNADDKDGFRKFIKQCFNAMLNATSEMERAPRGSQLGHWGVTWKQVVKAIKDKHPDIEGQFFTATGLRLQRIDSDLCEAVMLAMIQRSPEIVILPIHDSFIVNQGYEDELMAMMLGAYCVKFGQIPSLKVSRDMVVEVTGVPDWDNWPLRAIDKNNLTDLLELSDVVPSEKRLNLFREMCRC
jgi:hypothetical protein